LHVFIEQYCLDDPTSTLNPLTGNTTHAWPSTALHSLQGPVLYRWTSQTHCRGQPCIVGLTVGASPVLCIVGHLSVKWHQLKNCVL
jgi:hypothetical protein